MLNDTVFYHGIIRKTIVSFGRLFSNIYIDRKQGDSVEGTTVQRLQIPLAYAPKEKWLVRIEQDPDLNNHTYTSLPRMSFEITGYNYDSTRKFNRNNTINCNTGESSTGVGAPVPYNVNISLYVLTKTQEDGLQIVEQILPWFSPEYTLGVKVLSDLNLIIDVPVVLNGIQVADDYDGSFETRRFVTHTLDFTLKTNLFGPVSQNSPIYSTNTNIRELDGGLSAVHVSEGDPETYAITRDEWLNDF